MKEGSAQAMREYRLVGGTRDGERIETDGTRILRVPIVQPLRVAFPIRDPRGLSFDIEEYERFGDIYWWDGLTRDAWAEMDVSDEAMAAGGPALRSLIREQMRGTLNELAAGKGIWRIVWRITHDTRTFRHIVRAHVGPRAVERGLHERAERLRTSAERH